MSVDEWQIVDETLVESQYREEDAEENAVACWRDFWLQTDGEEVNLKLMQCPPIVVDGGWVVWVASLLGVGLVGNELAWPLVLPYCDAVVDERT